MILSDIFTAKSNRQVSIFNHLNLPVACYTSAPSLTEMCSSLDFQNSDLLWHPSQLQLSRLSCLLSSAHPPLPNHQRFLWTQCDVTQVSILGPLVLSVCIFSLDAITHSLVSVTIHDLWIPNLHPNSSSILWIPGLMSLLVEISNSTWSKLIHDHSLQSFSLSCIPVLFPITVDGNSNHSVAQSNCLRTSLETNQPVLHSPVSSQSSCFFLYCP